MFTLKEALKQIEEQQAKIERYEKTIHTIANIDTLFINEDGSEREWDYREAMEEIERLVMPVWEKHCKKRKGGIQNEYK